MYVNVNILLFLVVFPYTGIPVPPYCSARHEWYESTRVACNRDMKRVSVHLLLCAIT